MTVTGSTSADVATTSYVPPYKYVTSYAPNVQVTGSVTATSVNPVVTGVQGTSAADYATAYLDAHRMSWPSYRYAYLLWMVLALLAVIYALAHHLRLSGGSLGAGYAKWGMRRRPWGRKHHGTRGRALPSNSVLVTTAVVVIISCVLCVIGSDYITPSSSTLNFASSFRKRYLGYTINKAFWTSGSRFGFMAFALMPLVILLALKAPPIAILSLRPLTHLYADKLAFFHRTIGWLIWLFTTIHVVLWSIQLFQDQRNGSAVWLVMWSSYRFIFGCAAYGAMTALTLSSLRPVRKHRYEFFYMAHVVFVTLTIVCSAIHHPVLWFWMAGALALWGAERIYRLIRMAKINGRSRKTKATNSSLVAGKPYTDTTTNQYGMSDIKRSEPYDPPQPFTDKALPSAPVASENQNNEFRQQRSDLAYYDEGSLQPLGSYENRYDHNRHTFNPYEPAPRAETPSATHRRGRSSVPTIPPVLTPVPIPVGYAQAQLLPSRTVRLTIHVSSPFKWSPGQSVMLYLPDLSRFQSHPFTILNNNPKEIVLLVKARKGLTRQLFDLVRQRSLASVGIAGSPDKRLSLASMRPGQGGLQAPPVFIRALIDGPMGSAGRVKWSNYPSVLIICGGSGVSFGAAVCDYLCAAMKRCTAGKTQRVRFCWVVREYAEISWVAGQLRRCQDMVSATQLQIDIFVTNVPKERDDFLPPQPIFARGGGQRRGSADSVASEMSVTSPNDTDETVDTHLSSSYADVIDLTNYEDEEDTNDPVENQLSDRLQQQGKVRRARSRKVAKGQPPRSTGMPRSASSGMVKSPSYPPRQSFAYDEAEYDPPLETSGAYANPQPLYEHSRQNSGYAPVSAPTLGSSSYDRRQSYRSVADSMYGQYDPFNSSGSGGGGGSGGPRFGPSPSPSLFFDDNQSISGDSMRDILSRTSRTQSMVLLEDPNNDPTSDAALWVDESDYAAMNILSEMARVGKPKLSAVLEEELEIAQGSMIVATCGPTTLNTVVRNLVSKHISPARIRYGDKRGNIAIYSEDYEG